MANSPCPKCRRKTWSSQWKSCSGCGFKLEQETVEKALAKPAPKKKKAKAPFAKRDDGVTKNGDSAKRRDATVTELLVPADVRYVSITPEPGQPCPTCSQKIPYPSVAAKQKAYRKRQRTKA